MGSARSGVAGDPFTMPTYARAGVEFVRGEGVRLWDADGMEYLDFFAGLSVHNAGHCHPRIVAAVREQVGRFGGSSNLFPSGPALRLAERLSRSSLGGRVFLCNSGTEATEAAIKLAMLVKWRKLEEKFGKRNVERLMDQLGLKKNENFENRDKTRDEPVYKDYPMFLVGCVGAFHGRTLGSLNLTQSKKAHQIGYQKLHWFRHVEYNKDPHALRALVDPRPLDSILDSEGGVQKVLERGKIPADLCAGFIAEGFQGEGGYLPGDPAWFHGIGKAAKEFGIMLIADEVQSLGRTGKLYSWEYFDCAPDAIAMAKTSFVGVMLARGEYSRYLHNGWHSNTWGGGKVFDINIAYAGLDALLNYRAPHLSEISHFENEEIKGKYLRQLVERLKEKHKDIIVGMTGRGLMNALEVKKRSDVLRVGWSRGLKMLGAGLPTGDTAKIRVLHLADATTKEIEDFAKVLEDVCYGVMRGE